MKPVLMRDSQYQDATYLAVPVMAEEFYLVFPIPVESAEAKETPTDA